VRACTMFVVSTAGSNPNKIYIKSMLVKYGSDAIYGRLLRTQCRDGISVCFSFVYLHVGRDVNWGSYKCIHISRLDLTRDGNNYREGRSISVLLVPV
jgi:hypothetical protein